jgi:hypothetical protein
VSIAPLAKCAVPATELASCTTDSTSERIAEKVEKSIEPARTVSSWHVDGAPPSPPFLQVLILKEVKVLCFDTLLQVLILKDVRTKHNSCETCDFAGYRAGAVCGRDASLSEVELAPENKKAGEGSRGRGADFYEPMIAEGLG